MVGSDASTPRRRPIKGGYARGEETRLRIIQAAFDVFAEAGFVGASTRRIALRAGVAQPSVQYYFGSKDALYRACGQVIVDQVSKGLGADIQGADIQGAEIASNGEPADAVQALTDVIDGLVAATVGSPDAGSWGRFMARCEAERPSSAADVVDAGVGAPLKTAATALVARALGLASSSSEAQLRTVLILSQLVALWSQRDAILGGLNVVVGETNTLALVRSVMRDHVQRLLSPRTDQGGA